MDKLTLSITVDLKDVDQVNKLKSWLNEIVEDSPVKEETEKKKPKKKKHEDAPEKKPSVSIEEIRTLVAEKVTDYRADIKKKLNSFGAKNVTTLDEEHFDEFHDFLVSLEE